MKKADLGSQNVTCSCIIMFMSARISKKSVKITEYFLIRSKRKWEKKEKKKDLGLSLQESTIAAIKHRVIGELFIS